MIFDTKFCENQWRLLNFRRIWIWKIFLSWHQIFKIWCIHEASSVRKPTSSNILSQRKNFVKSVRKEYGNSYSHAFFASSLRKIFSWKKSRYYCQSTQNSLRRREMWFLAGVWMCVRVCMRACECARARAHMYSIFNFLNNYNS